MMPKPSTLRKHCCAMFRASSAARKNTAAPVRPMATTYFLPKVSLSAPTMGERKTAKVLLSEPARPYHDIMSAASPLHMASSRVTRLAVWNSACQPTAGSEVGARRCARERS